MESLRNCLLLNSMEVPEDPEEPSYILQPGWDDDEAVQLQQPAADSE